ncbi:MAG: LamG domain-containing protein, partial [Lentisphaeria bacterium]|nr:LamG domain-containing protein [Lentisphaeria bacterium]
RGPGIRFNFYYNSFAIRTGDGKKLYGTGTSNIKVKVTADEWHLATATYDGKTVKFYFDGVLAGEKDLTFTNAVKNRTLTIGSYKSGFCYPLRGAVDDLKFYNVCKSASEVAEKYISIFGE